MDPHKLAFGTFLIRLFIGAGLGLIIGLERQWRGRPAGAHTTGLVAAGAATFAAISPAIGGGGDDRIVANIVTGVGFLAGGVILREGASVTGLNTAATLWATAAVGALAGLGLFREAGAAAFAVLFINFSADSIVRVLSTWYQRIKDRRQEKA